MEQKRVSFKVAQAIKEAGYSQYGSCDDYYNQEGHVVSKFCDINKLIYPAPTYLDVWLWLWRTKKVELSLNYGMKLNDVDETLYCLPLDRHSKSHPHMKYLIQDMNYDCNKCCSSGLNHEHADPEEAIINAIDYLVDNNLIK